MPTAFRPLLTICFSLLQFAGNPRFFQIRRCIDVGAGDNGGNAGLSEVNFDTAFGLPSPAVDENWDHDFP